MKKFTALSMALVLTGALAFAEDAPAVTVGGYVNSGLKIVSNSDALTFQSYANDWGDTGTWATLGASVTGANYGVNVTVDVASESGVSTDTAYGWVSPFEGLKLFGGTGYSGAFDGVDDTSTDNASNHGVAATYTFGYVTVGGGAHVTAAVERHAVSFGGLALAVPSLVTFKTSAKTNGSVVDAFAASFAVTAVPGLTLNGGYNASGLAVTNADSADLTVAYAVTDALTAGVVAYDKNISTGTNYFTYKPNVSYKLSPEATVSAYLLGDTQDNPNYQARAKVAFSLAGGTSLATYVQYDTNPGNLASAVPAVTLDLDLVYSF